MLVLQGMSLIVFTDTTTRPSAPRLCRLAFDIRSVAPKRLAALNTVERCCLAKITWKIFQQQAGSKVPMVACVGSRDAGHSLTGGEWQPASSRGAKNGQEKPKAGRA